MDYDVVVKALKFLQKTHPSYKNVRIASADEVKWEEQSISVQQDPIIVNDKASEAHEAHMTSDIAEGWDPNCRVPQTKGSPLDADFGTVLCVRNEGFSNDPVTSVKNVLESVQKAKDTKTSIKLGSEPINEFTGFCGMLSKGFPCEFPLGVTEDDLNGAGPLKNGVLQRLLKFYDGRIGKNQVLHLWLTNIKMRHRALGSMSAYAKKRSQEELVREMNSEQFDVDCAIATKDPSSQEAKELVRRLGPLIKLAGSHVPWGPLERLSAVHHLYALYHTFGPPSFFITFAPKTLNNDIVLRLVFFIIRTSRTIDHPIFLYFNWLMFLIRFAQMQSGKYEKVDLKLPENLQKKVAILTSNPIAQARAYSLIVRLVAEVLFGIPATHTVKKSHKPVRGLFGVANAFYCVHEVQSRNALHGHNTLWAKILDPRLIHRVVHIPELRNRLLGLVESVVTASPTDFEHVYTEKARVDVKRVKLSTDNVGPKSVQQEGGLSRRQCKIDARNRIRKQSRKREEGLIRLGTEMYVRASTNGMSPLGWVRVVFVQQKGDAKRLVVLRQILRPGGEYVPSTCAELVQKAKDMGATILGRDMTIDVCKFDEDAKENRVEKISIEGGLSMDPGTSVWVCDVETASSCREVTKMLEGGHAVKSEYNTHKHTFTCHKYKDTFRARYCRMGFGRRPMPETRFTFVVGEEDLKQCDDPQKVDVSTTTQTDRKPTAFASKVIPPPEERSHGVVCLNLKRLCGRYLHAAIRVAMAGITLCLSRRMGNCMPRKVSSLLSEFLFGAGYNTKTYDDCYQCETNVLLSFILKCNTNAIALGSLISAANAMFYLAGYLSKNPIKPAHWVTCVTAGRKAAVKFGSKAEDAGTVHRNALFLLQKILNRLNALGEVADTQGSMLLLGQPSWQSSHPFQFCFVKPAVQYQIAKLAEEFCDDQSCGGCSQQSSRSASSASSEWSHPSVKSAANEKGAEGVTEGGALLYTDEKGVVHAVSQHDFYRHRVCDWDATVDGVVPDMKWWFQNARVVENAEWQEWDSLRGLESLSLFQYACHISVVPMPQLKADEILPPGMYRFNKSFPLYRSHIQKLKRRTHVASISGKLPRAPRSICPPEGSTKRTSWLHTANQWALFVGTLLSPWDRHGMCRVTTWDALQELRKKWDAVTRQQEISWSKYVYQCDTSNPSDCPDEEFPNPVGTSCTDLIQNLECNLRVSSKQKVLTNAWRYDCADKFTKTEQTTAQLTHGGDDCKAKSAANALAIAQLLDTVDRKQILVGGIKEDTKEHLDRLSDQLQSLHTGPATSVILPCEKDLPPWNIFEYDENWSDKMQNELEIMQVTASEQPEKKEQSEVHTDTDNCRRNFSDLRNGDPGHAVKNRRFPLSADQLHAFNMCVDAMAAGEQFLIFVHGPPGTGKTVLAGRIMAAAERFAIRSKFAALSGAAATLQGGTTLHYLANLGITMPIYNAPVTVDQKKTMIERGGRYGLLAIDEASMIHARFFNSVCHRYTAADLLSLASGKKDLCSFRASVKPSGGKDILPPNANAKPFGGMSVLLLGDMLQLPPPNNFSKAIFADCVAETAGGPKYVKDSACYAGVHVFRQFKKVELTTQNRAKGDEAHQKMIHRLRTASQPIDDDFLMSLRPLSAKDLRNRRWQFAPYLVTSNLERLLINKHQASVWTGLCVFLLVCLTTLLRVCVLRRSYDLPRQTSAVSTLGLINW